jgi:peptide chain release factor 1
MRVPPTEKRGRVHTSSVSVAVVNHIESNLDFNKSDVEVFYTRGSGSGGQHRNKVETCVNLHHIPSGIRVMNQDSRSKQKNEEKAWQELKRRIEEKEVQKNQTLTSSERKNQIGTGGRLKKRRTYRVTEGMVQDHITGKSIRIKDWERGKIQDLHS